MGIFSYWLVMCPKKRNKMNSLMEATQIPSLGFTGYLLDTLGFVISSSETYPGFIWGVGMGVGWGSNPDLSWSISFQN